MAVSMNPQNNVFDTMRSARPRINNSPSFASTTTNEVKPQPEKDEVVTQNQAPEEPKKKKSLWQKFQ